MRTYLIRFLFILHQLYVLKGEGLRCNQLLNSDALFSLEKLSSTTDYIYKNENYTFYFNFCTYASKKCHNESAYALVFPVDSSNNEISDDCFRITSDSLFIDYSYSLIDSNNAANGVQITYTNGDKNEKNISYDSTFQINCVKNDSASKYSIDSVEIYNSHFIFKGESKYGCPVLEISAIYNFIVKSQYFLAFFMLVVGAIECFYGLYLLGPSLFGIGFITGFGLLLMFCAEFIIKPDTAVGWLWVTFIICLGAGGGLGYLATSLPKIGFFGLGIWLGIVIAFILNNLVLYLSENNVLLYLLMIIFGGIGAALSRWKWKIVCVLSTSILGGYLSIRAFSIYIGGYPDELTIAKKIQYKELDGVEWPFYVYLLFMCALSIAGIIFQFKNMKKGGKYNGEFGLEKDDFEKNYYELSLLSNRKK